MFYDLFFFFFNPILDEARWRMVGLEAPVGFTLLRTGRASLGGGGGDREPIPLPFFINFLIQIRINFYTQPLNLFFFGWPFFLCVFQLVAPLFSISLSLSPSLSTTSDTYVCRVAFLKTCTSNPAPFFSVVFFPARPGPSPAQSKAKQGKAR